MHCTCLVMEKGRIISEIGPRMGKRITTLDRGRYVLKFDLGRDNPEREKTIARIHVRASHRSPRVITSSGEEKVLHFGERTHIADGVSAERVRRFRSFREG